MRNQNVDDVVGRLPAHVANFDEAGIRSGLNKLAGEVIQDVRDALIADLPTATKVIKKLWTTSPVIQTALADLNKATQAYSSTIMALPPNATAGQVVDAVINFWAKLLH